MDLYYQLKKKKISFSLKYLTSFSNILSGNRWYITNCVFTDVCLFFLKYFGNMCLFNMIKYERRCWIDLLWLNKSMICLFKMFESEHRCLNESKYHLKVRKNMRQHQSNNIMTCFIEIVLKRIQILYITLFSILQRELYELWVSNQMCYRI